MGDKLAEDLFAELASCSQVVGVALGGSRASGNHDEKSDYDIYVYLSEPLPETIRKDILSKYCSRMEVGNHYWELEDNCTFHNGIDLDIIYRNLDDFEQDLENVVVRFQASNGYTTCMWHNLLTCQILYDKEGKLTKMKKQYQVPYPDELQKNIITKNRKLLSGVLPSYDMQVAKAVKRGDKISINHRVTEFLASYFDILFAMNKKTHPGEKRLKLICSKELSILPEDFDENLDLLFESMYEGNPVRALEWIVEDLDSVLDQIHIG
ncbi:MAG: DUF4037 domain-containing protein [Lachnospiraceae bacterium]|nr:DUF4037 domain-containing protein [Lachnospiraceae bacterium]